jgi:hypothetical protein
MKYRKESIFLNEYLMTAASIFAVVASICAIVLGRREGDSFTLFIILVKIVTIVAMYTAYRTYKWDVAKGLMGGILFCLMFQEGNLVLEKLWGQEDFDTYLVVGVQGSIYIAAAGMSFLLTIIITINHFFINYAKKGNPENVIFNQMAISIKVILYLVLIISNSMLSFDIVLRWENALQYMTDIAILLLIVCIESQLDSFKVLRQEIVVQRQMREKKK